MSKGSVRDSLTLMEQVRHISYKKTISKSCIEKILGLTDDKTAWKCILMVWCLMISCKFMKLYENGACLG